MSNRLSPKNVRNKNVLIVGGSKLRKDKVLAKTKSNAVS